MEFDNTTYTNQPVPSSEKTPYTDTESPMALEIEDLKNSLEGGSSQQMGGIKKFEQELLSLGFTTRNAETYLTSVSRMHGSNVIVRRARMQNVFSSLETGKSLHIARFDTEPNAALMGATHITPQGSEISGIEAAMAGGFDWLVDGKVAAVFGFTKDKSQVTVSDLPKDSPSLTKKYGEVMKGVEGDLHPDDILFLLFRFHKSAYPDELCEDEDFYDIKDEMSGRMTEVRKPFVLRLYAKSRQTH